MYRAVAFAAMRRGIDPDDAEPVAELARDMRPDASATPVIVDGVDATIEIRSPEVTRAVSTVAANPDVRTELVRRQREWAAAHGGGVVEGRDIGTVVFPDAELKVYLTADDGERASRRSKEMLDLHYDQVAADIARRDHIDSTRPGVAAERGRRRRPHRHHRARHRRGGRRGALALGSAAEPAALAECPDSQAQPGLVRVRPGGGRGGLPDLLAGRDPGPGTRPARRRLTSSPRCTAPTSTPCWPGA